MDRTLNYGRAIVARFVRGLNPDVVVDLGPGLGEDILAVRTAHPKARVVRLEAHGPYADHLRSAGVDVAICNIERDLFPFEDESVDLIVTNQVFEHLKEVHWILHECARVLRVGGSLIIGVPNLASFHNRVLLAIGRQPTSLANWSAHVRDYTRPDLIATIDKPFAGGFRLAESAGENFYHCYVASRDLQHVPGPAPPGLLRALREGPALLWVVSPLAAEKTSRDELLLRVWRP